MTVGIAATKTLAKVANHLAKTSHKAAGVLDLTGSPYPDVALERTPVEEVWGVGTAYVDMLSKRYGRDTVRLAGANPKGRWRTKAAKRSPRYTTKLAEVLLLK